MYIDEKNIQKCIVLEKITCKNAYFGGNVDQNVYEYP